MFSESMETEREAKKNEMVLHVRFFPRKEWKAEMEAKKPRCACFKRMGNRAETAKTAKTGSF